MHWVVPCISNLAKMRVRSSAQVKEAPDDGTCTAGCEPRVQVCNWEKVSRYIRVSQRTSEVRTFRLSSLRLRVLEYTVREKFLSVTLEVFGGSVTDLGVGVRLATTAPLCSFAGSWGGSWRRTEVEAGHTSIQAWRGKLHRFGQQAGSYIYI